MEKHKMETRINKSQLLSFLAVTLFSFGLIALLSKVYLYNLLLSHIFILHPNSVIVDGWLKTPIKLKTNMYFFNWTNPHDFYDSKTKPKLNQMGPYTFSLRNEKANVVWNKNNTVTYNNLRFWNVDKSDNLTDKITIFNSISLFVADYIKDWNYLTKRVISSVLDKISPDLSVTKTALELIMTGYYDIFVDIVSYLPFVASEVPRFEKIGFLNVMNGTTTFSGLYNMANGINGNFDILNWNYRNFTPYYGKECSAVKGSGGELYSMKKSKEYTEMFVPELCRYIKLDFEKEVLVDGILGYKYTLGSTVLDNGTLVKGNNCYCNGKCLPSGMLNISACRFNLPTFMSLPHFYQADPVYLNDFDGLNPKREDHEFYIILEPKTSVLLGMNIRLQHNVLVSPVEGLDAYQSIRQTFFPIMWIEQKINLPLDQVNALKILLRVPEIILGCSIFIMTMSVILLFFAYKSLVSSVLSDYKRQKIKMVGNGVKK